MADNIPIAFPALLQRQQRIIDICKSLLAIPPNISVVDNCAEFKIQITRIKQDAETCHAFVKTMMEKQVLSTTAFSMAILAHIKDSKILTPDNAFALGNCVGEAMKKIEAEYSGSIVVIE